MPTLAPAPNPATERSSTHARGVAEASHRRGETTVHEKDIPAYWAYARQFTLCDRYFTDVAGPSTPNHLMLIAAASPIVNNPHHSDPPNLQPPYNLPSLPASLEKAGYTLAQLWRLRV